VTRLRRDLSLVTTLALPEWSAGPGPGVDVIEAAAAAGYEGVQVFLPDQAERAHSLGLAATAVSPARTAADVDNVCAMWSGGGAESLTLHLGTGFETPDEGTALVAATLEAQERHGVPLLIETHRATITQDPARTLLLVSQFPELRFTADLSHWYTGVEMVYGDFDAKVEALAPVFERCRMIHGRISDPGCIQVAVADDDPADYVEHFMRMWSAVIAASDIDVLPFAVELLPARAHYARTVERDGRREEEVDRWEQADVLWRMACSLAVPA
jgi:hypothetical protein